VIQVLRKLNTNSSEGTGQLPFLNVAIESGLVNLDTPYEVTEVSESRARNGYVIRTKSFVVFIWKSSPLAPVLIETLVEAGNDDLVGALMLIPNNTTVDGFELAIDEDLPRMWVYAKKLNVLDSWKSRLNTPSPLDTSSVSRLKRTKTSPH
jgi:hypothetical protein